MRSFVKDHDENSNFTDYSDLQNVSTIDNYLNCYIIDKRKTYFDECSDFGISISLTVTVKMKTQKQRVSDQET